MLNKCGYSGCKNGADFEIQQLVGEQQTLPICTHCAPNWVKSLTPSKYYQVRKIGHEWIRSANLGG